MAQLRDLNVIIIKRPKFIKYIYSFIQSNKIWFHIHKIIKRRAHKVHLYVSGTNPKWDLFPNLTFDLTWTNKNKVKKTIKKWTSFVGNIFFSYQQPPKSTVWTFFLWLFLILLLSSSERKWGNNYVLVCSSYFSYKLWVRQQERCHPNIAEQNN